MQNRAVSMNIIIFLLNFLSEKTAFLFSIDHIQILVLCCFYHDCLLICLIHSLRFYDFHVLLIN